MNDPESTQEQILNEISAILKEGGKTYEMLPKIRKALSRDEMYRPAPLLQRKIRATIHDARMGNVDIEESHNYICELMQENTNHRFQEAADEVDNIPERLRVRLYPDEPKEEWVRLLDVLKILTKHIGE